ncbi:MAG: DNA-formamidopyrimidine glycosylase [SAR324 cluster bacterium]|uniref:DNA-formamidopyrimidine glycosylase n=1 Tax=SAR324 cluster bacterium TaxID=2024889 RepID=A0A2A4T962_9DELT|nr:MAG: DNA-formamidopyrimidine glycosylase [SAR324 cluster bacterium]
MPELPEVQTIVNDLAPEISQQKILGCAIHRESVLRTAPQEFVRIVVGAKFVSVKRVGKYILFSLDERGWLLAHLRMTGKFILQQAPIKVHPHDRVVFALENGKSLIFSDVRCFGTLEHLSTLEDHIGLNRQGWDPWSSHLTASSLRQRLEKRRSPIKTVLLDQTLIAGLGNIYAAEILFDAAIDPQSKANSLSLHQLKQLVFSIRKILDLALIHNGTSISDYRRVDDQTGEFQHFLKVYGKTGTACVRCSTLIIRIKQNQRSTFLCPHCQK